MSHRLAVPRATRRLISMRTPLSKVAITALLGAGAALSLTPGSALAATTKTLYVSSQAPTDPACSAASSSDPFATIAGALACAKSGSTIKVGAGTFAGGVTIPVNVVLEGAGANLTTISNSTAIGAPEVTVAPGVSATIENLAVSGMISGATGHNGGIVAGSGSLTLDRVTVDSVTALFAGEPAAVAVIPASGNASLTVLDSTISNTLTNSAGGIFVSSPSSAAPSTATVINSTISNAQAQQVGGIDLENTNLTARDDTIDNNYGNGTGGLLVGPGSTATVTDSLIAGNSSTVAGQADCGIQVGAKVIDGGHNLIGTANPDCGFANDTNGDLVGSVASPLNPDLAALAANGGSTQTQALEPGSPAIGAGNAADCEAAPVNDLDQRGDTRAATTRNACDIGAYDTGGAS